MLEQNGYLVLDPPAVPRGPIHGAVVARHLMSRARKPQRMLAVWHRLLDVGGRIVLLESAHRRGLLRAGKLLFPPRRAPDSRAPYRRGLPPAQAALLLEAAGFIDIRCFALPGPPSVGVHYLASARRR